MPHLSLKYLIYLLLTLGLLFILGIYLIARNSSTSALKPLTPNPNPTSETQKGQSSASPSASPLPFRELTIPYLRDRKYESSLASLQPSSESTTHTSYVTSYSSDGLRINGLLTQPKGDKPPGGWPAIVFVHGYIPPNQYQTVTRYVDHVNFLARNGFVVFKIDLRGHGNSEGEPGGGYYSSDYIIDTLNARAALQTADFVNPSQIGLWGHSMAGNVTLRSFVSQPEIPAVVIWAGAGFTYSDLQEYRITDNSYRPQPSTSQSQQKRQQLFDTHGSFSPNSAFWQQVAPTNYLDGAQGAIQLHHAVDDSVVSIEYSRNLNSILDHTTIPHQLNEYASGGHNINGISFTQAMQKTVDFYQEYLQ